MRFAKMELNVLGLEQRIETLINECKRLSNENRSLKTEHLSLLSEKTQLTEKNRLACTRLERIVLKLRTLEDQ
jgi:cell division protein ZapB